MCIDFDSALVMLLPLRLCCTHLRSTKLATMLPIDNNIYIHKMVGCLILVWSLGHTVGHLGNAGESLILVK